MMHSMKILDCYENRHHLKSQENLAARARLVVERYCAGENAWRVVGSPVPLDVADHDDEVPFGIATLWAAE